MFTHIREILKNHPLFKKKCELARDHWWSEENGETICQLCHKNYSDLETH